MKTPFVSVIEQLLRQKVRSQGTQVTFKIEIPDGFLPESNVDAATVYAHAIEMMMSSHPHPLRFISLDASSWLGDHTHYLVCVCEEV